jgi:diguanylate cyclase (GGDEF)-like protein/PAS domain S-box-containing protein
VERLRQKSEERFRGAFEHAPFGICVCGLDWRFLHVNGAFCRMLGYSEQELMDTTWPDLIHADDQGSAQQRREHLWTGWIGCADAEMRCMHRTGTVVWTRMRVSLVRDSGGNPLYSVVHVEDITERKRTEEALHESEDRFRIMADGCAMLMWVTNVEGEVQFINRAYREFFGTGREQVQGGKWQLLIHPDERPEFAAAFHRALREHAPFTAAARVRRADGEWRWLETRADPRLSPGGEFLGHVGLCPDITESRQSEQSLRSSEEKFRQLAENIREVFWMTDSASKEVLYVSPAYEKVWGQPCEDLHTNPENWTHSIHPEDRSRAQEAFLRQVQGEILENEYRIVQPSGAVRWIRDRAFPVRDSDGNIVRLAGVAEDMTERKLSELQLLHQALYDELTDLPNRRLFREKLAQAINECAAGTSVAVIFIDLDHFKLVNDTLGHSAGDLLMKEVAQRLLAVCGESGTLARFGGDEFTLVAAGFGGPDAVRHLGNKLITCLDEPFRIADREVFIGASIGISLFPENGTDPEVLQRGADVAMHEAKRAGKNQLRFFTPVYADVARERLEMETRLRRALSLSEFRLMFQPQFAPGRSLPSRFEALVRWYSPDHGSTPPLKFIPIAEQNGLIIPIGTWVLREACRQCAEWQTGTLRGTGVAVNVSASQFACPDFVEIVVQTLESTGLPARLLELELTESVFIRDAEESAHTMAKLRNLGVTIALDDFGTGYSSLSYLQKLPLDALKIDRAFLTENESRPRGAAVLRCVVELAHTLGLRVIGEGVQTTAQLHLLSSLGCDEMQGLLLGRPRFAVTGAAVSGVRVRNPAGAVELRPTILGNVTHDRGPAMCVHSVEKSK